MSQHSSFRQLRSGSSLLVCAMCIAVLPSSSDGIVPSVKNMRPVVPGRIYRSATLDGLTARDAEALLSGEAFGPSSGPLAAVVDLRNADEIEKGRKERTEGSELFYSAVLGDCNFVRIPFLEDVDEFWNEAIRRMDGKDRLLASLGTVFQGGALDRAAARNLENGGHGMLNTMIMQVGAGRIGRALEACRIESQRGPVIFHCQKGKDRTGVLAMLMQSILRSSDEDMVQAYAMSGEMLGEGAESGNSRSDGGSNGLIDWSYFRGSPATGMVETLEWTEAAYGSVGSYLEQTAGYDASRQRCFREQFDGVGAAAPLE